MKRRSIFISLSITLCALSLIPIPAASAAQGWPTVIVSPRQASWMERLAAHEVRRYIYLRTGLLLPMMSLPAGTLPRADVILVQRKDRPLLPSVDLGPLDWLGPLSYWLKTITQFRSPVQGGPMLLLTWGDVAGVLYAA